MTDEAEADNAAIARFLADPETYGGTGPVERIDTHISHLYLVGDRAFKLKRAVRFPYLDFSTVEARRRACMAEVAINRRTAPNLYLGVAPVRRADGGLRLGAPGEAAADALDWVVVMRRFDQDTLFDRMAERGELTVALAEELADVIAAFHEAAAPVVQDSGADALRQSLRNVVSEVRRFAPDMLDGEQARRFESMTAGLIARHAALLDARARTGLVRHCHGDLHLRNICLTGGRPTLFDAIEFDEAIATIDVLYDLAFLLMDLEHRGLRGIANAVLNRYLWREGGYDGLAAMGLFLAMRAGVRAHVAATQAGDADGSEAARRLAGDARSYLALALSLGEDAAPGLVAVGGLSGTGKSTLSRALAPLLGRAPGAVVLRSDVIRKRLFGVDPHRRLPPGAYDAEATERVYDAIRAQARIALDGGFAVVADAVYAGPDERGAIETTARAAGAGFHGLWLEGPLADRLARIDARRHDASDATAAIVRAQEDFAIGDISWSRIDASGGASETLAHARRALHLG